MIEWPLSVIANTVLMLSLLIAMYSWGRLSVAIAAYFSSWQVLEFLMDVLESKGLMPQENFIEFAFLAILCDLLFVLYVTASNIRTSISPIVAMFSIIYGTCSLVEACLYYVGSVNSSLFYLWYQEVTLIVAVIILMDGAIDGLWTRHSGFVRHCLRQRLYVNSWINGCSDSFKK